MYLLCPSFYERKLSMDSEYQKIEISWLICGKVIDGVRGKVCTFKHRKWWLWDHYPLHSGVYSTMFVHAMLFHIDVSVSKPEFTKFDLIWFYCLEEKNINHYMLKFRKLIVIIGWLIVCICITVYINICIVLHLQTWTHKYVYRVIFLNTNTTHNFRTCSFRLSVVLS